MIVYTLQLAQGKYYVGRTNNLAKRLEAHRSGHGSAWTNRYAFIDVIAVHETDNPFEETAITLAAMAKYGIDNVRGGPYVQLALPPDAIQNIQREMWGAKDKCFNCGGNHFVNNCSINVAAKPILNLPPRRRGVPLRQRYSSGRAF